MRTISHREPRNRSSEGLREVSGGAIIEVTNHAVVAAVLVPPSPTTCERLVSAGKVRPPAGLDVDLRRVPRVRPSPSSADILADVRR